jgi:hypothetical protein
MAYLRKNDIVIISNRDSDSIHARVVDVRFRRFRRSVEEIKKSKNKSRWKSVPYAVCEAFIGVRAGTEFLIPGYKLKNIEKNGEKLLVLRDKYVAEFGGPWVKKVIEESHNKRSAS